MEAGIAWAQTEWKTPILVGGISVNLRRGEVVAQNVFLGDPYSPRRPLVAAQEVRVRRLFSRQPDIQVVHPVAHVVRLPDGRWNFSALLPKRRPAAQRFWTLHIADGTLHFEDHKARPTLKTTLRGVSGEVRTAADVSGFRFSHRAAEPPFRATVNGWWHNRQLRLRVDAADVPVSKLLAYTKQASRYAGDARATGTVWVYTDPQRTVHYFGSARVEATQAQWRLTRGVVTLRQLRGEGSFQTGIATWQAQGKVGSGQIRASGTVQWQPQSLLDVWVDARQISPRELQPWLRQTAPKVVLHTPVSAQLRVQGLLSQPYIQGEVQASSLTVDGLNVQDFLAKGRLNAQAVTLPAVNFKVGGGTVRGGAVAWKQGKEWQIAARWRAQGVNLARLRPHLPQGLRGIVSAEGLTFGTLRQPSVFAHLQGYRLSSHQWRFERAQARVRWTSGGTLCIDGAVLEDATGFGTVSGQIDLSRQRLALRVRADEVLLSPWLQRLLPQREEMTELPNAWVYGRGQVEGTFRSPVFRGVVEATDLKWRRWSADYLVARIEASPRAVRVEGGILRRPPMEVIWQGEITEPLQAGKARIALDGVANHVDLQELLTAFRERAEERIPLSVEGMGRVFFHMAGRLQSPAADITWNIPAVQIENWNLTSVNGALRYEAGAMKLQSLLAKLGEGTLSVAGERNSQGQVSFRVVGENLPLAQVRRLLPENAPPDIHGTFALRGEVSGSDQEPQFRGELQAKDIWWDVLQVNEGYAELVYQKEELLAQNVRLATPEGEVALRLLRVSAPPRRVEAEGTVSLASLEPFTQRVMDSGWLRAHAPRLGEVLRELGRVSGSAVIPFRLWGDSTNLAAAASVHLRDIELDGRMFGSLQAEIHRHADGSWQLPRADLTNGEHRVMASGVYHPDGDLRLSADVYNFDLSWFQRWIPQAVDLRGRLEMATLEMTGKSRDPDLVLTVSLKEAQVRAVRAERVLSSKVQLSQGKLDISEIVLAQQEGQVRLWGTLPFRWEPFGIPDNEPIDVHVEAAPQPLRTLLAFLPAVKVTQAEGGWSLKARLAGTRATPQLFGQMQLNANTLRAAPLTTGLRDVRASLELSNSTVRLSEFSAVGDTPRGGRIVGSGVVQFGGQQPERIDASVKLERFWLAERNLSGLYGEQIRTFLDGELRLSGSANSPLISGTVTASGGLFALPASFPARTVPPRPSTFNPRFDNLVLRVGAGMWLSGPRLSTQASGDIVLSGTFQEPEVHGLLGLERGYVYFPTARFRLEPGGTIALDYPVPGDNPFRVSVNMQATTSLSMVAPAGGVRRYGITVQVNGSITAPEGLRTEFRSDPPELSAQQIARALGIGTLEELLSGRNLEQLLQREAVNLFTSAYVPQLFLPLERGIEEALQLREFRIEYGRYEPVTVTLVKRLWGGFSLSYWRTVSTQQDRYLLKILYELPEWTRLSRRLMLSFSVDDQQVQRWGIEGSFRF
jgi:hypothetical protein